ncbi:hypothetical protein [Occallatibacter riparius]|uniref:Uncharacterized protein n=1 Tax=Occallatibacter riparius TaxID=1002689 RepID=A0A9J7BU66_9BACT|nr:hypothetical protein [Occallatibacter riparius]UWZ86427.1 hypothetical protein MOP44_10890 [Occallatibacter riparius]
MDELLGAIFGFLFELLGEFLFELLLALIADGLSRLLRKFFVSTHRAGPLLTIFLFALAGLAAGFLSVWIFPHPLVHPSRFHGISLILSPLAMGCVMGFLGQGIRRRGRRPVAIESFRYGFTFALAMAIVRFLFVHPIPVH